MSTYHALCSPSWSRQHSTWSRELELKCMLCTMSSLEPRVLFPPAKESLGSRLNHVLYRYVCLQRMLYMCTHTCKLIPFGMSLHCSCGLEAEECWNLVQSFAHCHRQPPSLEFVKLCAKHGEWLPLLCHAEIFRIPPNKVTIQIWRMATSYAEIFRIPPNKITIQICQGPINSFTYYLNTSTHCCIELWNFKHASIAPSSFRKGYLIFFLLVSIDNRITSTCTDDQCFSQVQTNIMQLQ